MQHNFDQKISRIGTHAIKWEFSGERRDPSHLMPTARYSGEEAVLPMWIADMDFISPQPVVEALVARARHGIYGYTDAMDSYYSCVVQWMKRRHGWEIEPDWICTTPGVVPALNLLVRTFVGPGERVIIQPPVYRPFFTAIENNAAEIAANPLLLDGNRYRMDFNHLEELVCHPQVKMAILCNPHNPVGRVWTREELLRFGEICLDNDVLMVADEIHGDLVFSGNSYIPLASLGEAFARRSITCTAPSKTFNLAGLQTSNIIIPDAALRARFQTTLESVGLFGVNAFASVAVETAYNSGEEWLDQLLAYLEANLSFLEHFVRAYIPQICVIRPEGTYLVWLDFRELGLDKHQLKSWLVNEAKVYLEEGSTYGPQGVGFARMNIGCPRAVLAEALERLRAAIERGWAT